MNKEQFKKFDEALQRLKRARQNYNNATSEYVEAAIYELKAAEKYFDAVIKEIRKESMQNDIRVS